MNGRGAVALAAAALALAGSGCDAGERDGPRGAGRRAAALPRADPAERKAIRAAVVRLFRSSEVREICERSLTPRLFRLIFTGPAACRKATATEGEDRPPERVEVSDIRARGARATARTRLSGGDTGGAEGVVSLARGEGGWRTDDLSTPFLRSMMTASLRNEREVARVAGRCVNRHLVQMPDARFKRLAYSLIGNRTEADTRLLQLLSRCERRGGGVSSVRRSLERSFRGTLRRAGADRRTVACALRTLRRTLPDDLVIELAAEKSRASKARVTREVVAAAVVCGGGPPKIPPRLSPA